MSKAKKGPLLEWASKQKTPQTFKIVVFFLSDQPQYNAFVKCVKSMPGASDPKQTEDEGQLAEEIEIPGYQYGGISFKLIFLLFLDQAGQSGFTQTRATNLIAAAADVALAGHCPLAPEEKEIYESTKSTLTQIEGVVDNIGSAPPPYTSGELIPFFVLSFADTDQLGKQAMTAKLSYTGPNYFLSCPMTLQNDHFSKLLHVLFLGADKKLEENYLNLSNDLPSAPVGMMGDSKGPAPAQPSGPGTVQKSSGGGRRGCTLF